MRELQSLARALINFLHSFISVLDYSSPSFFIYHSFFKAEVQSDALTPSQELRVRVRHDQPATSLR